MEGKQSVNGPCSSRQADIPRAELTPPEGRPRAMPPGGTALEGWQEVVKLARKAEKEQPQKQEKDQGSCHGGSRGKLRPTESRAARSGEMRRVSGRVRIRPEGQQRSDH